MAPGDPRGVTIAELRRLLLDYDHTQGQYPENEYEGLSVWRYLCERFGHIDERLPQPSPGCRHSANDERVWANELLERKKSNVAG